MFTTKGNLNAENRINMKKTFIAMMAAAVAIVSCGQNAGIGGEWNIVSVNGTEIATQEDAENQPFFGFDLEGKMIYGSTGCNRLTGALNIDENNHTIDLSSTGSTKMMCPDMTTEDAILKAMAATTSYKVKGTTLLFLDSAGNTTIQMQKK